MSSEHDDAFDASCAMLVVCGTGAEDRLTRLEDSLARHCEGLTQDLVGDRGDVDSYPSSAIFVVAGARLRARWVL